MSDDQLKRIAELAAEINGLADRANARIREVNEQLPPTAWTGKPVWFHIDANRGIGWARLGKGSPMLVWKTGDSYTALGSTPRKVRVFAVQHIPALLSLIEAELESAADELDNLAPCEFCDQGRECAVHVEDGP